MLEQINPNHKTIVFCADEKHAAMIRDAVNKYKDSSGLGSHADYCVRITASEKEIGDQFLREFRDNDKQIPTIVTTSRKLSTGVDSRNVRFIVLMRKIGSMVEFKQIVGRGTRVYDGKDYFTIVDFYGNDEKFSDAEWDGEPAEIDETSVQVTENTAPVEAGPAVHGNADEDDVGDMDSLSTGIDSTIESTHYQRSVKTVVRLSDGKTRSIQHSVDTQFYFNGRPVNPAEFVEIVYGELPTFFSSEEDLRRQWQDPAARELLLDGLAQKGFDEEKLNALKSIVDSQNSDLFDVLRYIAYAKETQSRAQRADYVRQHYMPNLPSKAQPLVDFILNTYEDIGENELTMPNLKRLLELQYKTMEEAVTRLGSPETIVEKYKAIQKSIYVK
jgi:type I restriction enzyme R subunit